ncbi:hypothetical protein ACA910_005615 [Epithemia clementina (nom. ined.)]
MASGFGMTGGPGRCYGFYTDFRDCYNKLKHDASSPDANIKANERQQEIADRIEDLKARMDERLDADPSLRQRFDELSQPVMQDPAFAKASARFERAQREKHPETARGLINEMNEIAESKPERHEAYKLIPEFKELKDIEKMLASKPHPVLECMNYREDYFECLHGDKFHARLREIDRVATLKAKGQWPPKEYAAGSH